MDEYLKRQLYLAKTYGLNHLHNPGGELWICDGFGDCQISGQDCKRDYETLVTWLRENDAENLDSVLKEMEAEI